MPDFDPATFRLRVTGLVDRPRACRWSRYGAAGRPPGLRLPLRHRLVGRRRALGRLPRRRPLRRGGPAVEATHVAFRSLEEPYVDQVKLAHSSARHAHRRPHGRRAADGEHGAPLRLVIPQMYGYKGVKWLSESAPRDPAARLLGAARLRHRRLGGPLQWLWLSAPRRIRRFARTERAAALVRARGLRRAARERPVPVLPALAGILDRPPAKAIHLWSAAPRPRHRADRVLGDRRALRAHRARGRPLRPRRPRLAARRAAAGRARRRGPPAGRFNAGQKLNAVASAACARPVATGSCLSASATRPSASAARCSCTTGDAVRCSLFFGHLYLALLNPPPATRCAG